VGLVARKLPRILHLGLRVAQVTACRAIFATNGRAGRRTLAPTSKARNLQRSSPTRGTVAGDLSGRTAPGSARPTRPATGNGVTDTGSGAMKNSLGKPSGFPFFSSSFPELALPMPHRSRAVLWGRVYPGRRGWGRNRSREPDAAGRHKAGPTGGGQRRLGGRCRAGAGLFCVGPGLSRPTGVGTQAQSGTGLRRPA